MQHERFGEAGVTEGVLALQSSRTFRLTAAEGVRAETENDEAKQFAPVPAGFLGGVQHEAVRQPPEAPEGVRAESDGADARPEGVAAAGFL